MSDHETEILSADQIEEGPAGGDERPWRVRLAASEDYQDLISGVESRWAEHDLDRSELEGLTDQPDRFVGVIAAATGLTPEAVEDQLDELAPEDSG